MANSYFTCNCPAGSVLNYCALTVLKHFLNECTYTHVYIEWSYRDYEVHVIDALIHIEIVLRTYITRINELHYVLYQIGLVFHVSMIALFHARWSLLIFSASS